MRTATLLSQNQQAARQANPFRNSQVPMPLANGERAVLRNSQIPSVLTDGERIRLHAALNTMLSDPRTRGLLSREPLSVGRSVSVTSQQRTVYEYLNQMRSRVTQVTGATPEEALRSLVGNGREYGNLQESFETMLGTYAQDVIGAMQRVSREMRPSRNLELCREDF